MPPEELRVYQSECLLRLNEVMYSDFMAAVKRFGFLSDLSDEHMKAIAPEIRLDYNEMENNEMSGYAVVYMGEAFKSKDKRHNVKAMLRLGWFLCQYMSQEDQFNELWHLINP